MSITKNLYIVRGESKNFPLQAFNSAGGIIDLTSATIIFTVKESTNDVSPEFTRSNTAAGGNDNEVEVTSATDGLFLVKVSQANSLSLNVDSYYYDVQVNDGSNHVTHTGAFVVQQSVSDGATTRRTSGTTAQRPTLTNTYEDIGFGYYDTTIDSKIFWNGTKWDVDI